MKSKEETTITDSEKSDCPNCNAGWFNGKKCHDCGTDFYHGIHLYKGDEFPDSVGERIHVWDDHSNPNAPCYKIQFVGSSEVIDNMDDLDIDFVLSHQQY